MRVNASGPCLQLLALVAGRVDNGVAAPALLCCLIFPLFGEAAARAEDAADPAADRHGIARLEAELETLEGSENPRLIEVLLALGAAHRFRGDPSAAIPYFRRSLEEGQRVFPSGHPSLEIARFQLAAALVDAEPSSETEEHLKSEIDASTDTSRPSFVFKLSSLYRIRQDPIAEERLLRREIQREGGLSCSFARCEHVGRYLLRLGQLSAEQGRFEVAVRHFEDALTAISSLAAERSDIVSLSLTAECWMNLGDSLQNLHRLDRAEEAYRTSVKVWDEGVGTNSPALASALERLAGIVESRGRRSEAAKLRARADLVLANPAELRSQPLTTIHVAPRGDSAQ